MILANIIFGTRRQSEPAQLEDVAESYLASICHDGQLCGDYFITWTKGRLNAHVLLAGKLAMEARHHSPHGKKELKKVVDTFGAKPVWRILDDDAEKPQTSWKGAPFLYVFTHAFDRAPPVCRGDGQPPIPTFTLPLTFEKKEALYFWQGMYRHHDNIWIGSGALEIGAYRQLADPSSELAGQGRKLCREIEAATGVPTFYYLTRFWGRTKREAERPCPGCGGEWKVEWPPEEPRQFRHFDFKCVPCRMVSHTGVSTDGGRHTRIGEFDGKKANPPVR